MTTWRNILSGLAALALATSVGCGIDGVDPVFEDPDENPDFDPGDPDTSVARQMFDSDVAPVMAAKCAACHTGLDPLALPFLGTTGSLDPSGFYGTIVNHASVHGNFQAGIASLITKVPPVGPFHETDDTRYTQVELDLIVDWLRTEALERGDLDGDGSLDPLPANNALAAFSACMTLDDWNASQMYRWANKGTNNDGPCEACHREGAYRFNTNNNANVMYEMNRYELYIIGFFTVMVEPDGSQMVVPAYDKLRRFGTGVFHPNYGTGQNNAHFLYLEDFYQRTMQRMADGLCGPPEFPQPPDI